MSVPHVELKNINFSYNSEAGPVPILDNLSFSIQPGEMVAIQGPSGSGKSTLLYLLGGLLKPTSGEIWVEGQNLLAMPEQALAHLRNHRIGFVFQQFFLLSGHSVTENVLLPEAYSPEPNPQGKLQKALGLIEKVGLLDRQKNRPNQLSGGQQQRVAIARALLNDAPLILADEPTGNLDSKSADGILNLFRELNQEGRTLIIITHDESVAKRCDRILSLRDGRLEKDERLRSFKDSATTAWQVHSSFPKEPQGATTAAALPEKAQGGRQFAQLLRDVFSVSIGTLRKNRARTLLTMLGVSVGIAAVLSMLTIGRFAKQRMIDSYADLGVNTMMFYGYEAWKMKASDRTTVMFQGFQWDTDLKPLFRIFPMIDAISPVLNAWASEASFGGQTLQENLTPSGVNEWAELISNRGIDRGRNITPFHVENNSSVCLIGPAFIERLFQQTDPLGQILTFTMNDSPISCRIIGILSAKSSSNQWHKPNLEIILPYTHLQSIATNRWEKEIHSAMIRVRQGTDIEKFSAAIKNFFEQKYGKSAQFNSDNNSTLVAQMQKFLTLFSWLLACVALVTLLVGGMGITNMMLVSVTERYKEIGLRKALGATHQKIRLQFLGEAVMICAMAGVAGLVLGVGFYEVALWFASKFSDKITFVWWLDPLAISVSMVSILIVGLASGLLPAMRAEKLQVIEALRSE